jgi:NitT/TauT family transport system substrate-binding protein
MQGVRPMNRNAVRRQGAERQSGRRRRRRGGATARVLGSVAAAGALVLASSVSLAGTAGATAKKASHTIRIVIGGGATFTDASLYKAIAIMKHDHITVDLSVLTDPSSALEAVVSGKADVYLGDPIEAATAVANSQAAVKYIGTVDQTTDYEILSLPKYSLKNLTGAILGSAGPGTAGIIIADAALSKEGISPSSLQTVTVGGTSARVTALLAGQVDLAPALAPAAVAAESTGKVKILLNTGKVLGKYLQEGLIASESFIKHDASTVQTMVNAFLTSQVWSSSKEAPYIALANANKLSTTMTPAEEQSSWKQLVNAKFFSTTGAICPSAISVTEGYSYETTTGTLKKTNTPKYRTWVDPTFVKNFLKDHHESTNAC